MKNELLIGTYTRRDSEGIMALDLETLAVRLVHKEKACTYLVRRDEQVYSVFSDAQGAGILILDEGKVYSGETNASCHLAIHPTKDLLASTNYGEGSLQFFTKVEGEWKLAKRILSGEGSHQHFVYFTKDGEHIIVCDLGLNQLVTYDYEFNLVSVHQFKENIGPRHFVTSYDEQYFYLLSELSNELLVLERTGLEFKVIQRESILLDEKSEGNNAAAIRMSADNQFIYTSTRNNEEAITVFKVEDHLVKRVQYLKSGGLHPRDINLSAQEDHLIVANKDSDNLVFFKRDQETGQLSYDYEVKVSEPVCVLV